MTSASRPYQVLAPSDPTAKADPAAKTEKYVLGGGRQLAAGPGYRNSGARIQTRAHARGGGLPECALDFRDLIQESIAGFELRILPIGEGDQQVSIDGEQSRPCSHSALEAAMTRLGWMAAILGSRRGAGPAASSSGGNSIWIASSRTWAASNVLQHLRGDGANP